MRPRITRLFTAAAVVFLAFPLHSQLRFSETFDDGLSRWVIEGAPGIEIRDSGEAEHGPVLELTPNGNLYALINGSEEWGSVRVEGDVLFPQDSHNYLGVLYNFTRRGERVDFGNFYIKGNGSYIRVNPHRDGLVGRTLYEEFRTPLRDSAAILIGEWQHFKLEVVGREAHFYVGEMDVPKVVFPYLELDSGAVGFQPRCCGSEVWIDNIEVSSIDELGYTGPRLPAIEYKPDELLTEWEVIGPLVRTDPLVEQDDPSVESRWQAFQTDERGAVITSRITDFEGPRTAAYFRTSVEAEKSKTVVFKMSSVDNVAAWINGRFLGFMPRQNLAWYDFWETKAHAGYSYRIDLDEGENHIVIRVRGGVYASGGFFARLEPSGE